MNPLQRAIAQHAAVKTVTLTNFTLTSQDAAPSTARAQQIAMFDVSRPLVTPVCRHWVTFEQATFDGRTESVCDGCGTVLP